MNRKNLTAAVLAGLAGAAGIASTAQAVNMNPDGLGQVLIYPYYTVNGDNVTLLSVVNTTDHGKAVKVRFLEGMNSVEVLDFNLYMSAYDVWAGAIVPDGEGGAALTVQDTSCTVPTIEGQADQTQEFLTLAYAGGVVVKGDGGPMGRDRLTEGYFEMIEMGTIEEGSVVEGATEHVTDPSKTGYGRPANCDAHVALWSVEDDVPGAWLTDATFDLEPPSGGLFGGAAIVNPGAGTMYTYSARALDGYSTSIQHSEPGTTEPSLATGDVFTATVFDNGETVVMNFTDSLDAVSAVFMHDALMNEYNTSDAAKAMSEWVITFPTKRDYVNGADPIAPFTDTWSDHDGDLENDGACEIVKFGPGEKGIWNREEETIPDVIIPGEDDEPVFSPSEEIPGEEPEIPTSTLCSEVNVLRFGAYEGEGDYMGPTEILGSSTNVLNVNNDALGFEEGWFSLNLLDADDPNTDEVEGDRYLWDDNGQALGGLPVTGFWVVSFENGFVEADGGLAVANYGGIFDHKSTRLVSAAE
jgi:hypothetical protein